MYHSLLRCCSLALAGLLAAGCEAGENQTTYPQAPTQPVPRKAVVICRLLFQDHQTRELRWADVLQGDPPTLAEVKPVDDFPRLDPEKQTLVQMEAVGSTLLVGVRDEDNGQYQSGWALLSTGVAEEAHGDHAHWSYDQPPRVLAKALDDQQGNPAHLYVYDDVFYLANDARDGYTRIDPASLKDSSSEPVQAGFHQGGGHHITLAVFRNATGYGAWIDSGGPHAGRVDLTVIQPQGNPQIARSFTLPTGSIHGATTAADKVFFAPADGICWVSGTLKAEQSSGEERVRHIPLGVDPETKKPLRTGAFSNHRDHVLFVTGQEDFAALGLLNAAEAEPALIRVPLPIQPGHSPTVPAVVKTAWGQRLAFVFHNHKADVSGEEFLSLIELDPDQNLDFADATLLKTIPVGRSAVSGHYGHHEIAFDHAGRLAFWSNPGDGTITVMDLHRQSILTTWTVGGMPTKLIARGEEDHAH